MNSNAKQGTKRPREHHCSKCGKPDHIRTTCPELEGLNKYQRRGTKHYWSKQGEVKAFNCVSGTRCLDTGDIRCCLYGDKCPECLVVRLMGLEQKMTKIQEDWDNLPDRCNHCDPRCPLSEAEGHVNTICNKKEENEEEEEEIMCHFVNCGKKAEYECSCSFIGCKNHWNEENESCQHCV